MKNFQLTSDMLTMGGTFYPKGYAFIMFPDAAHAKQVALEADQHVDAGGDVMLLSPSTILKDIGKVDGQSDVPLPSVGTEGFTVRKYVALAREGHHAVMAKIASDEHAEDLMQIARKVPFSYGQRYHLLAMEDLE